MTDKWVTVDRDELNRRPREEQIAGVPLEVYFSPYDMPHAVGGGYDESKKHFVIQFRYPDRDESITFHDQHQVRIGVGKKSGRVYQIELDADAIDVSSVEVFVDSADKAIKELAKLPTGKLGRPRIENYKAASGALEQRREELIKALAAAS